MLFPACGRGMETNSTPGWTWEGSQARRTVRKQHIVVFLKKPDMIGAYKIAEKYYFKNIAIAITLKTLVNRPLVIIFIIIS